jgi:dolichyl-phosphate beta-glucosyltransferase
VYDYRHGRNSATPRAVFCCLANSTDNSRPLMLTDAQQPSISVIIPCYNEERNLERGVLDEVYQYLEKQAFAWEIIIVDDGSTDNSRRLIERSVRNKENVSLFDIPHGGKPAGIWEGIQRAKADVVLFTDMDQSTPIDELGKLLPWYEKGFDVVIGSRNITRQGSSPIRKVGSLVFLALRRLFLLRAIIDTQCGFKLCRREAALKAFPNLEFFRRENKPAGWKVTAYDVEFLYLVEKLGYRIKEVTVSWENRDRSNTKSSQGDWSRYMAESINMAQEVARVKLNQLLGLYDKI